MSSFKTNVILLLFYTMLCITYAAAKCSSPDVLSPCICSEEVDIDADVILSCSQKTTTLEQVKNSLNALKGAGTIGLELEALNLGTVPSNFFQGFKIVYLDISQCPLDSLSGGGGKPLEGLEDTLDELIITSSFTEDRVATTLTVSHLKNLRELDISYNTITKLGNDWFKDAPASLKRLTLSNNGIETIGDRAFADLANLEFLALDGNRFGSLSRSMLPNPANELDTLELDNNAFMDLPGDIFSNMPYLKMISLTSNGLRRLEGNVWRNIWSKVDGIDLRGNPLECDSQMDWISEVQTCADISGTCATPYEKSGQEIPLVRGDICAMSE